MSKYEVVIGIETHVQLATKTKLFCGCNNDSRTAEPNKHVCPVCIALPGSLPVLNKRAVELALRVGLALNGKIPKHTKFDRKNYFYPDSPSGYQITQFDQPIVGKGFVEFPVSTPLTRHPELVSVPLNSRIDKQEALNQVQGDGKGLCVKRIGVTRAHLEADAGKLTHPAGKDYSLVDLNRAGTPLMEIVSEPDIRSAAEAKAYAQELYHLMRYANVSDADLYYGNMRFDVNVSLRPVGQEELGTRTETKNLNSFRAVYNSVEFEIKRQTELLEKGEKIVQETRGWDEDKQKTFSQRSKEEAHDYRYFPEPDLPPLVITEEMLGEAKKAMPKMMPNWIRNQLTGAGISEKEQEALIGSHENAFLWSRIQTAHPEHAKFAFNWLTGDQIRLSEEKMQTLQQSEITQPQLTYVAHMIETGKLSSTNAKILLANLWDRFESVDKVAERLGLIQVSDTGELEKIVDQVIADNPGPVEQYKAGEVKVTGFLVGQVMKASKGQANPPMVNEILIKRLKIKD